MSQREQLSRHVRHVRCILRALRSGQLHKLPFYIGGILRAVNGSATTYRELPEVYNPVSSTWEGAR